MVLWTLERLPYLSFSVRFFSGRVFGPPSQEICEIECLTWKILMLRMPRCQDFDRKFPLKWCSKNALKVFEVPQQVFLLHYPCLTCLRLQIRSYFCCASKKQLKRFPSHMSKIQILTLITLIYFFICKAESIWIVIL